ncbi:hypothetical protein C2S52_020751 [Perilla frutescens var. hirtella]|nr:hypothetical protein C2S52_020751 [Perilla frutescens var. hirtella]
MSTRNPSLSTPELMKLKFDEVQNIMIEREKNIKMEMAKLVRECDSLKKEVDFLEISQSSTNLEKCSLEQKLERSEGRCEELEKQVVEMEEKIQKLRSEKLDIEEKLGKSERRCDDLDTRIVEIEEKVQKFRSEKLDVERKKCEDANQSVEELNVSANLPDFVENEGVGAISDNSCFGLSNKGSFGYTGTGGRNSASNSGVAETKGAVKNDQGKKVEVRGGSHRASLSTRCSHKKIIKKIRKNLQKENLEKFEQSCFGHLLNIKKLKFQGTLMLQLLMHMDMDVSNEEKLVFKINNSNVEFRPSDFSLITGLLCYGTLEATTTSSSSIHKDVFHSRACIGLKDVKKAFLTASRDNEGRGELTLKLALLYFLYGILLPRNGGITKSDMKYFHLVGDLEKFKAYPWSLVAYQFLVQSILSARARMDGLQVTNKKLDIRINGFSYALQAWAYEVLPPVGAYCATRANNFGNLTPPILCWSTKKTIRFNDLKKFFTLRDKARMVSEGIQTSRKKKIKVTLKWTTPLSRHQPKKRRRKLLCTKDQMSQALMHEKQSIVTDCSSLLNLLRNGFWFCGSGNIDGAGEETENGDGKVNADAMSSPDEVRDHSSGSGGHGSSERDGTYPHYNPAVAVPDNRGEEPQITGDIIITISDSDDGIPDMPSGLTNKRNITDCCGEVDCKKRSKPTAPSACDSESPLQKLNVQNDVDSTYSDDESCSDAYMNNFVSMIQSKIK